MKDDVLALYSDARQGTLTRIVDAAAAIADLGRTFGKSYDSRTVDVLRVEEPYGLSLQSPSNISLGVVL